MNNPYPTEKMIMNDLYHTCYETGYNQGKYDLACELRDGIIRRLNSFDSSTNESVGLRRALLIVDSLIEGM